MKELNYGRKSTSNMTVRIKSSNFLIRISELLALSTAIIVVVHALKNWEPKDPYGFVDLQMRFKHYVVTDKYQEDDEDIKAMLISKEEAKNILENEESIDIKAYLMLQMFEKLGESLFI